MQAHRIGVRVVAGTDSFYPESVLHRIADELAAFVEVGFTPLQAIQTATTVAAELLAREQSIGALAPGFGADLMVVAENPLVNVRALEKPLLVLTNGRIAVNRLTTYSQ